MVRRVLRSLLPVQLVNSLKRLELLAFGEDRRFTKKSRSRIFDEIYQKGSWGVDGKGETTSGGGSHNEVIVSEYLEGVRNWIQSLDGRPKVADMGCGDFSIGSQLVPLTSHYLALDVSEVVIERNRSRWAFDNVDFQVLDIVSDQLPSADVGIIRQVLQHLGNVEVSSFCEKVNKAKPFRHLIVSEHIPADPNFKPNLPKKTGPGIRMFRKSGVVLHEPPFSLESLGWDVLCESREDVYGIPGLIRTTVYRLK